MDMKILEGNPTIEFRELASTATLLRACLAVGLAVTLVACSKSDTGEKKPSGDSAGKPEVRAPKRKPEKQSLLRVVRCGLVSGVVHPSFEKTKNFPDVEAWAFQGGRKLVRVNYWDSGFGVCVMAWRLIRGPAPDGDQIRVSVSLRKMTLMKEERRLIPIDPKVDLPLPKGVLKSERNNGVRVSIFWNEDYRKALKAMDRKLWGTRDKAKQREICKAALRLKPDPERLRPQLAAIRARFLAAGDVSRLNVNLRPDLEVFRSYRCISQAQSPSRSPAPSPP